MAVPGVTSFGVGDNASPFGGTNQLTQFILGGRTQVKAMLDAQPTFVSVWIGNNDVLGSLTDGSNPGDPALLTPEAAFEANYGPILDSIERVGAKAVLISVEDVTSIPYATAGAVYWCLKTGACPGVPGGGFPASFSVSLNCAPRAAVPSANGDSVLVSRTVGVPKLSAAATGAPTTLDCSLDNEVVLPSEYKGLRSAVVGYNAYISGQAQQRGWAYVDVNPTLLAARAETPGAGQQPKIATSHACRAALRRHDQRNPERPFRQLLHARRRSSQRCRPPGPRRLGHRRRESDLRDDDTGAGALARQQTLIFAS